MRVALASGPSRGVEILVPRRHLGLPPRPIAADGPTLGQALTLLIVVVVACASYRLGFWAASPPRSAPARRLDADRWLAWLQRHNATSARWG